MMMRTCFMGDRPINPLKPALFVMAAMPWVIQAEPQNNTQLFGLWRVVSILDAAEITGVSQQRASAYIGKTLYIDTAGFQFDGMMCNTPSYRWRKQDTARYLRESWHARSGQLGLPDTVTVVDARCTDIFIKGNRHMVFNWKGYFLEATRMSEQPTPQ